MKFQATHYERNSRHQAWASKLLEREGFADAIITALQHNALAATDILREHMRPVAYLSFQEVTETEHFSMIHNFVRWIAERSAEAGGKQTFDGEVLTQAIVAWHTARFDLHGRQTYVPTQSLSRLLLSTELRGLKCADMTLPYPSVYIAVDPELGFTVHNEQTGAHPLYGIYISDDSLAERRGWRVLLCGDRNSVSQSAHDDALSHFFLDFSDDKKPVAEAVSEVFALVRSKGPDWCRQQGMKDEDLEDIIDSWEASFKWAMNLLFYVTRPDFKDLEHVEANGEAAALWRRLENAPKGSKKRERILDQYRAQPKRPRIVVGRRVVVDERLPRTVGEALNPVMVRTLVPSHWQRYRVGAGRAETVWKQKDPYWRGPEDAPVLSTQVHEVL